LPETEVELRCVAQNLGGKLDKLVLGEKFTETEIKRLPLDRYRIIHFATHALLADETSGFGGTDAEPALVLTPPKVATPKDDGLLKASEIAQLKLNADWVILSACNTAAAGSMDTDALSGLARAFFYAGARTLLVSHWAVDSAATVILISRAFGLMAQNHQIEPAEAIRQSMLSMMAEPVFAHPAKWAPFVLIGDNVRFM
jgi:CHAT domain-containing protein